MTVPLDSSPPFRCCCPLYRADVLLFCCRDRVVVAYSLVVPLPLQPAVISSPLNQSTKDESSSTTGYSTTGIHHDSTKTGYSNRLQELIYRNNFSLIVLGIPGIYGIVGEEIDASSKLLCHLAKTTSNQVSNRVNN